MGILTPFPALSPVARARGRNMEAEKATRPPTMTKGQLMEGRPPIVSTEETVVELAEDSLGGTRTVSAAFDGAMRFRL